MKFVHNDAIEEVYNNVGYKEVLICTGNLHSGLANTEQNHATTRNFGVLFEKVDYNKILWINQELGEHYKHSTALNCKTFKTMTALEVFEFIDDEKVEYILDCTKYGQFNNWPNPHLSKEETFWQYLLYLDKMGYRVETIFGIPR